jgi:hypothetical protein
MPPAAHAVLHTQQTRSDESMPTRIVRLDLSAQWSRAPHCYGRRRAVVGGAGVCAAVACVSSDVCLCCTNARRLMRAD